MEWQPLPPDKNAALFELARRYWRARILLSVMPRLMEKAEEE